MATSTNQVINQDMVKESMGIWKDYVETYNNFVLDATKLAFSQTLAFRENMDAVLADGMKQAQSLSAKEQETALNNIETFSTQSKSAYRRMSKMVTPITLN